MCIHDTFLFCLRANRFKKYQSIAHIFVCVQIQLRFKLFLKRDKLLCERDVFHIRIYQLFVWSYGTQSVTSVDEKNSFTASKISETNDVKCNVQHCDINNDSKRKCRAKAGVKWQRESLSDAHEKSIFRQIEQQINTIVIMMIIIKLTKAPMTLWNCYFYAVLSIV